MCIRRFSIALATGLMLVSAAASSYAQNAGGQTGGTAAAAAQQPRRQVPVAVIDLGYLIKNHPTMKQEMERIKSDEEAASAEFEKKRQAILKEMESLRDQFKEGTPEFSRKEAEIAAQDTEFRLSVVRKNKQFQESRAQVFYQVHQQVTEEVSTFCQYFGTFCVLRINREKMDPKRPETIEMGMSQEVFYYQNSPDVDITDWVLNQLKARATQTAARPGAAVAPK